MFERFTDRARRVMVLAQEQARGFNHNYIGSEHLLLGLLNEGEGVAFKALSGLGVSLESAQEQVRLCDLFAPVQKPWPDGEQPVVDNERRSEVRADRTKLLFAAAMQLDNYAAHTACPSAVYNRALAQQLRDAAADFDK